MTTLKTTLKTLVFCGALVAMILSLGGPISAQPAEEHQDPGGGGGSGSLWTVTCVWDGAGNLQSRTCTSGGGQSCAC